MADERALLSMTRHNGRVSMLAKWTNDRRYRVLPRRRHSVVIGFSIAALVAVLGVALLPSPYVIDVPGPVFDTLGQTKTASNTTVPVIEVSGAQTYPTSGNLNLLTVSQWGSPTALPSAWQVLGGWISSSSRVMPIDEIYPPGTTNDSEAAVNSAAMVQSQQSAIAAALIHLGYSVPTQLVVAGVSDGSHAAGVLQQGDILTSVNGDQVTTVDEVLAKAKDASDANPLSVAYTRNGTSEVASIAPMTGDDGTKRIGVSVTMSYAFPIDVTINLQNVGGPSAGMMFALGIIDTLTPGDLTGGHSVAGTGTITSDGKVGAIGGIEQKMVAAANAGSTLFLAPADNCDSVVGHVPAGIAVVKVSTLDDALSAVTHYAATGSADGLPACTPAP